MKTIECGRITAEVSYDTTDPRNKGWYAAYIKVGGSMIADSQKVGHPDMPRRKDARKKAERIAHNFACKLDRQRRSR